MPGPTLYARYVPPKAVASAAVNNAEKKNAETNEQVASTASPSLKRKREEPVGRKERKRKSDKENIETHSNVIGSLVLDQESQIISDDQGNVTVPAKPKTKSKSKNTESAKAPDEASEIVTESEEHVDQNRKTKKKEKWKKQSADSSNKDNEEAEDDEHTVRHAGVFSKFQKALDKAANKTTDNEDVDMDAVEEGPELHGLSQNISYLMITTPNEYRSRSNTNAGSTTSSRSLFSTSSITTMAFKSRENTQRHKHAICRYPRYRCRKTAGVKRLRQGSISASRSTASTSTYFEPASW